MDSPRSAHTQISARQPLLLGALFFAAGLWMGRYMWRPPSWWVVATVVFAASAMYLLRRRNVLSSVLALASFFLAGALTIQIRGSGAGGSEMWFGDGQEVFVTAHVIAEGNLQSDAPDSVHQRLDVETEQVESGTNIRRVRGGVRVNIYSGEEVSRSSGESTKDTPPQNDNPARMQLLRYGQRIRFPATLNPPHNFRNPGAFDYAEYLRDNGIAATASAKYESVEMLQGFSGSRVQLWRVRVHRSIIEKVHALWPEEVAGLMDAMVVGEESFIDRPTRVDFQRSGTYHVLVVSGMNVSILAMFTLWTLRRLGLGDIAASVCAIVLILAYAELTNVGPPVWRAGLMFAVYLATRLLYRKRAMLNALGAAALALLIADPQSLFGASFQMTFLCVGLVAGVGIPLLERTIEPFSHGLRNLDALAYDRQLPPRVTQFRLDMRLVLDRMNLMLPGKVSAMVLLAGVKVLFGFIELVVMSAVLQIGLALPMAYYFHRATSVAMPANLLVIPFLQLLMPAAVLAIAVGYVSMALAKIPAVIAGVALQGIAGTVQWLGGLRLADIRVATPSLVVILCSGLAIMVCVLLMSRRVALSLIGIAALAATAFWIWTVPPRPQIRPGVLEMTAIDVGQGDSILLVSPEGRKVLVDAGGLPFWAHSQLDIGEDVVSPYLWARGISRIDAIALTHAHADHMGGMAAVIANFRPREFWLPQGISNREMEPLLAQATKFGVAVTYHQAGDAFQYGGTIIRVLAPSSGLPAQNARSHRRFAMGAKPRHANDESLVLKVSYGSTSALLEGDAEKKTERVVATEDPAADVLKVAHHGSASSTNADLLAAVRPRLAVISVGTRNVYHHPRREVLERLQQARVTTYRTDANGTTTFYLDGKNVTSQLPGLH